MAKFLRAGGIAAVVSLTAALLLCIGVSAASAAPASLTVSILPTALTQGNQGVVQATFNNGGAKLTGAAVFLTFGSPVTFTPGSGCSKLLPFFPKTVVCPLGVMAPNTSVTRTVTFTVPATGPVTVKGVAGYVSFGPLGLGLAKGNASAPVYPPGQATVPLPTGATSLGGTSNCVGQNQSVVQSVTGTFEEGTGTAGSGVTTGSSNPAGLPCTPIITGVVQNNPGAHGSDTEDCTDFFTDVPNGTQVTITLTFPDECMPWPASEDSGPPPEGFDDDAGTTLYEWPNYPDLSVQVAVPACLSGDVIPAGYDTCVVSIAPNDDDNDFDTGSITLKADYSSGDPGYHGG
jgi:hypothetical protein